MKNKLQFFVPTCALSPRTPFTTEGSNGVKFLFFSYEGRACERRKMKISHSWWALLAKLMRTPSA
jgi:hypothetical protein